MKKRTDELKEHDELNKVIPEMSEIEWTPFSADVKIRGVLEPIRILPDGRVIDGRHRVRAAKLHGIEELAVIVMDLSAEEAITFGVNAALLRRNLNEAQRLELASNLEASLVRASKKERAAAGGNAKAARARGEAPQVASSRSKKPRALAQAAAAVGESQRKVRAYKKLKTEAPDLAAAVRSGEKKFSKARAELRERTVTVSSDPAETSHMVDIELPPQVEDGTYTLEFLGVLNGFPGFMAGWRVSEGSNTGSFLLQELDSVQDFKTSKKAPADSGLAKLADALSGGAAPPFNLSLYVGERYQAAVRVVSNKCRLAGIVRLSDAPLEV